MGACKAYGDLLFGLVWFGRLLLPLRHDMVRADVAVHPAERSSREEACATAMDEGC